MFVDLTASYNTVWQSSLTFKLLPLLPNKHMISMILGLVRNCSFMLSTGSGKLSRLRALRTASYRYQLGFLSCLISTYMTCQQQPPKSTLDMVTPSTYLQKWELKLSTTKTTSTAFHFYNKEPQRKRKISVEGRPYLFVPNQPASA